MTTTRCGWLGPFSCGSVSNVSLSINRLSISYKFMFLILEMYGMVNDV